METFLNVTLDLLTGFGTTVKLFALTLVFSLPLGLIFSFCSMSKFKPISALMKIFIWIMRGTPLMLQLIVVFYGPGLIGKWAASFTPGNDFTLWLSSNAVFNYLINWVATWSGFERFTSVLLAFVLNYSCYFSEIYRGGIESIPKGQYEAGQVLGMTKTQIFFKVVLLQVIKRIIPPMSNEIITLVKDTSLARIIAVYEIIWSAQVYIKSAGLIWPLFYTGAFYLIFNGLLTVVFRRIEKRLDYFRG